jgi:rubrerythrin
LLASKGYSKIYNLAGGYKGWESEVAYGDETQGLELFSGLESTEKSLTIAYSLEQGLREFYLSMLSRVANEAAKQLFEQLADIEIIHQKRIFAEFLRVTAREITREEFEKDIVGKAVEGGLTTDEYINRLQPDLESPAEIIGLAMAIEAQALDLYQRAADRHADESGQKVLMQIAKEEQTHLKLLGDLMEKI